MKWYSKKEKPQSNRLLICYCPKWCLEGYQIAVYYGNEFHYDGQQNDEFHKLVKQWAYLAEVE